MGNLGEIKENERKTRQNSHSSTYCAADVSRVGTGQRAEDAALAEQLAACRMPYICPRGKPVMIFKSNRELSKNFDRD